MLRLIFFMRFWRADPVLDEKCRDVLVVCMNILNDRLYEFVLIEMLANRDEC